MIIKQKTFLGSLIDSDNVNDTDIYIDFSVCNFLPHLWHSDAGTDSQLIS